MGEGTRCQPCPEAYGGIVPHDQGCKHLTSGTLRPLAHRQHAWNNLHCTLAGNVAMALTEFNPQNRNAVQEGRRAGVAAGPTTRQHCGASASSREQALAQLMY